MGCYKNNEMLSSYNERLEGNYQFLSDLSSLVRARGAPFSLRRQCFVVQSSRVGCLDWHISCLLLYTCSAFIVKRNCNGNILPTVIERNFQRDMVREGWRLNVFNLNFVVKFSALLRVYFWFKWPPISKKYELA